MLALDFLMSTMKDPSSRTPRVEISSAVTRPFSQVETAEQFAAIRERMVAVAADLRQMALRDVQPDDDLLSLASKLETMATEKEPA
jgi:hypothetical protein